MASPNAPSTNPAQPTAAAIAIGSALVAGVVGYFLGQASSLGVFSSSTSRRAKASHKQKEPSISRRPEDSTATTPSRGIADTDGVNESRLKARKTVQPASSEEEGDSEDTEDSEDEQPGWEIQDTADDDLECKLVLVVRTDLGMTKGKIAAQASHATLACYRHLLALSQSSDPSSTAAKRILDRWLRYGQAKVAVQAKSEDELEVLQGQAMSLGVCAQTVRDAGRTQIAAGSVTVLGVGPAGKSRIDGVTGSLKLL